MIDSTIRVSSGSYDVKIGRALLPSAGEIAASVIKPCRIGIITDDNVAPLYLSEVRSSFIYAGFEVHTLILPHGEKTKSIEYYSKALEAAAGWGLQRSDMLAALGGGVIGDLTGFTAATYMRGIDYIQIPTTLLAAVDSSVGGKTAIDLDGGKNLCGAFHQPRLVICDTDTLGSLDAEVLADGAAEAIKCGVIRDEKLFDSLTRGPGGFDAEYAVRRCVQIKADIVGRDEFDRGERRLLNFGHTIAHAVEKLSGYSVPHGRAVAIGMSVISKCAAAAGYCDESVPAAIDSALKAWDLPRTCGWGPDELDCAAMSDKKIESGVISLILPKRIGEAVISDMRSEDLKSFLGGGMRS